MRTHAHTKHTHLRAYLARFSVVIRLGDVVHHLFPGVHRAVPVLHAAGMRLLQLSLAEYVCHLAAVLKRGKTCRRHDMVPTLVLQHAVKKTYRLA